MIIKKDSEIAKSKVEKKSLALKAKKESSDEECSTSGSEDEEYAMASDSGEKDDKKVKNEMCLVAQVSSEVCSESSYFSDENSSIDDLVLDNEYDKLCKRSLQIITKNKRLKATRNSLEKELSILKEKVSTLEKNKGVNLECVKCHMLKIENEKLKEEALKLTKFEKSTHYLNEMLSNQKPSGDKLGLGFNLFEASSSGTKEIKFVKAQKKAFSDGGPTNMGGPLSMQAAPKAIMGPPPVVTPGSEKSICIRVDLEPDEWIKDSGYSKHITGNQKLFSSYKAHNGGNVIFGSNLRGNIIGKGQICDNKCRVTFSEHDSEITKDGKVIGRGIRKKGLYVMKLGNKPKDQICLATIDENSTLWHRRLGHANMRLIQSLASKELVRNLPKLKFDQHFCDACKIRKQAHASHKAKNIVSTTRCLELLHMDLFGPSAVQSYGGNRYTLVIVDDYSRKVEESLNVTFDENPPPSKTSPLVDDDLDKEEAIKVTEKKNLENDIEDEILEIDKIVNIKESRNHLLENVIGNLNQRTLRSQIQNQSNFFCFISTVEPKNVNEALADEILLEKHDPPVVYDLEETLQLAQESRLKMKQLNKEIKPANYTKINHLSGVSVSQTAMSREELYLSNTFNMANVSKSISIPNEEFSDDTTPSVARKFLNEIYKIVKDEIFPIVNQVDARVQNFKIQFLKEAAKFVRDFQSLAKDVDESLAKHKALELEIKRLLRYVVSQDIMSIVQNNFVIDTSNLQTELEHTKERFENCIIKKENEYAKLWNDWYKKCEECKYDKISYDKAYNDMQQKIERLQAQLGDQKGKSKDTPCVSNTLDPLPQKLENEIVELEFQVSEQKDTNKGTSVNTQFSKQSILGKPPSSSKPKLYSVTPFPKSTVIPKVGKSNALSKPVTSNLAPSSRKSAVVNNERVIALGIFRINPFKASRVDNFVPNKHVKASVRTKPITVSQPHVVTKEDVNSNRNGFSPNNVESTTRTRRPQPRNNPKSDKVPFKSKSSCLSNKLEKIEENHRSLQSSNNPDHTSSECNNIKLAIRNEKSEVICATCKQCLITANHDECVLQYVNGMKSRKKNQSANVSKSANQKKHKPKVRKPKKVGSKERLASPKPSTPSSCLRWSPTGRMFDLKGKIIATSESVCQSDCSKGDNACSSNPQEPIFKRFPNLTFSMTGCQNLFDTLLIPLLFEYKSKDKETHGDNECDN
ncbi:retrovirus-related pol polyprotein from transposon TNT 1-94 [Tanacetum coccineum]